VAKVRCPKGFLILDQFRHERRRHGGHTGHAHSPSNVLSRVVKPSAKRAGLVDDDGNPWVTTHMLRHTAASRWFRAGIDAKRAQVMLGHHHPAFTLKIYTHLMSGDLPDLDVLERQAND